MDNTMTSDRDLTSLVCDFRDEMDIPLARLAKRAGLSTGTVSNVANAKPGRRFDDDTERKIRNAIARWVVDASNRFGDVDTDDPEIAQALEDIRRHRG